MSQNFYSILNVPTDASRVMIREAYLRMKNTFINDNSALYGIMTEADAKAQMDLVEEAFRILNDESKRSEYDRSIGILRDKASPQVNMPQHLAQEAMYGLESAALETGRLDNGLTDTVQTLRSTLRVTRTTAKDANDDQIQKKYADIIANDDLSSGLTLVKLREAADVSEAEILERTKISIEYVRALESNTFERLPQTVYVKGFIRNYLKYISVKDAETVVQAFGKKYEAWRIEKKQD